MRLPKIDEAALWAVAKTLLIVGVAIIALLAGGGIVWLVVSAWLHMGLLAGLGALALAMIGLALVIALILSPTPQDRLSPPPPPPPPPSTSDDWHRWTYR